MWNENKEWIPHRQWLKANGLSLENFKQEHKFQKNNIRIFKYVQKYYSPKTHSKRLSFNLTKRIEKLLTNKSNLTMILEADDSKEESISSEDIVDKARKTTMKIIEEDEDEESS